MRNAVKISLACAALSISAVASLAQTPESRYGTAKFESYKDIDKIKELKVVWDFNFADPRAVGTVFNYVNALLNAVDQFGPHEIEPVKVVVVSHGPELVIFAKRNLAKYNEIVERAAALAKRGVRFEICINAATFLGFTAEDFHGFATVVPPAPYALAYWQSKGYTLNANGATMPITALSEFNRADTNR